MSEVRTAAQFDSRDARKTAVLPPGQLTVQAHGQGWFLVQIGRATYTKRFNLSDAEARQLLDQLGQVLSGGGR